jgi:hypothetical protein
MASSDELPGQQRSVPAPGYVIPAVRCALEMILVACIIGLLGLPAENPLILGIVLLSMLVAMVVVLFWSLNQHMAEWIRRAQGKPTLTDGGTSDVLR